MTTDEIMLSDEAVLRELALKQLKKKRDFHAHLLVYAMVNTFLVVIWLLTNAGGFFWPVFPIAGWGIGVVMNAWDVYRGDFAEDEIRREMDNLRNRPRGWDPTNQMR